MSECRWDLVHVITELELGGAQLATLHEIEHSPWPTGRRVLIHGPGGMLDERARAMPGVECVEAPALVRAVDPRRDPVALWQLVRSIRSARSQGARLLVHTHSSKAGILGRTAARLAGADRVVHSIHGFGHNPGQPFWKRSAFLAAERAVARVTDGFSADSAANLEQAEREGILLGQPARVVRCAIEVAAFETPERPPEEVRRALATPPDVPVVLNVSCLKPQKDPQAYLRVAARVLAQEPRAVFWLAGDGELRAAVESLAARLGIAGQVRLLGWRHDIADLLHAADLLALTSRWEGLPQTFAQAMAARRPIVATRVDGAAEAVADGESGLLFPVGDVEGMARGIVDLMADEGLRARMGDSAYARVGELSVEKMLVDLGELYDEVVTRPRRTRLWRQARS